MLRQILIVFGVLALITCAIGGYVVYKAMQETVTPLKHLNPESSGPKAVVVYSPGVSDFHEKVNEGFTSGLIAAGWSVDEVTASHEATNNFTGYSLLVIGGPIHGGKPSKPILDYMERTPALNGVKVFVILTSSSGPPQGEAFMSDWISSNGGQSMGILSLSTTNNTPRNGLSDPVEIAAAAAQAIPK
jgi:hypothetical protein